MSLLSQYSLEGKLLFSAIFVLVAYFGLFRPGLSLAPWVPTAQRDLERVRRLARLQPGETFVEAGCGNARVALAIARQHPEVRVIGIELSVLMVVWAKLRAWPSGLSNLTIKYGDVLKVDLTAADVVYTYALTETVNEKLLPKVLHELKPGARFISYSFKIEGDGVYADAGDKPSNTIYVYQKPAAVREF